MDNVTTPAALMDSIEFRQVTGISRSQFYELAKQDRLPVRVIRVGRKLMFSRAEVERMIGGYPVEVEAAG